MKTLAAAVSAAAARGCIFQRSRLLKLPAAFFIPASVTTTVTAAVSNGLRLSRQTELVSCWRNLIRFASALSAKNHRLVRRSRWLRN